MKKLSVSNAVLILVIAMLTAAAAWWLNDSADKRNQDSHDHAGHAGHNDDATPRGAAWRTFAERRPVRC